MMGVLHRLGPTLLNVEPRSKGVTRCQLALFLTGSGGMLAHFRIGEWTGMSRPLRIAANLMVYGGSGGTALGILFESPTALFVATTLIAFGVGCFVVNIARVVRCALLKI